MPQNPGRPTKSEAAAGSEKSQGGTEAYQNPNGAKKTIERIDRLRIKDFGAARRRSAQSEHVCSTKKRQLKHVTSR